MAVAVAVPLPLLPLPVVVPVALPLPKLEAGLFLHGMTELQAQQAASAEQAFRKILQARPSHAASHHFLGAALYSQGKLAEARTAMRRSLELMGPQPQWLQNLANVESALGNVSEAEKLREKASHRRGQAPQGSTSEKSEKNPIEQA